MNSLLGSKQNQPNKFIQKLDELLCLQNIKHIWNIRKERMLKDKIDAAKFFVWFIENYPNSAAIMKKNPEFQYTFQ